MRISGSSSNGLATRLRRGIAAWAALAVALGGILTAPALADIKIDVPREVECLALTIYFEARGEPVEGKLAVGHVVMNRAAHPLFPGAVCEVVQQGVGKFLQCQFTWWCDGLSDQPVEWQAWETSKALARRVYWDYSADPTGGALWYHADYVRPGWGAQLLRGPKIGRHIFYRQADNLESKTPAAQRVSGRSTGPGISGKP